MLRPDVTLSPLIAGAAAATTLPVVVVRRRGGLALLQRDDAPEPAADRARETAPVSASPPMPRVWEENGLRILLLEPGLHWSGTLRPSDARPSLVAVDTRGVHTVYILEIGGDWRALVRRAAARLVEDDPATAPYIYGDTR